MSEDYREDINQNVPARRGWTRWWSRKEWAKVVPGGESTLRAIRLLLGGIWSWVQPVGALSFPGLPDLVVWAAFALIKAYFLPLAACALLVFFVWLTKKLWRAWQQRS